MSRWMLLVSVALGLAVAGCSSGPLGSLTRADDEEDEVKVKLEDCPKAVQETIKKEVGAGKVEGIEKETENGKTVYEAEVSIDGKTYELTVGEDGKLISKEQEDDEDDDEDDDR